MTSDANTGDLIATFKISGHGDHQMRGPVTIGRDPRADEGATIEVDGDPLVSKSHMSVDVDEGDLIITDLGSSNGTYLHHSTGETAVPSDRWIPIPAGAEIEFGDQRMTVERVAPLVTPDPEVDRDNAATIEHATPAARPAAAISDSLWAAESDAGAAEPVDDPTPVVAAAPAVPTASDEHIDCSQCQRELPPGSKFCDGCGARVMPGAEPTPVADDPGHTVVVPPGGFQAATALSPQTAGPPPAQYGGPAPRYGGPPAGPPPQGPPPGPPPGQFGQSPPPQAVLGAPPQQPGGLVFVDPSAAASPKSGAGKKIVVGIVALVVLGLIGFGLVTLLGGGDKSTAAGRGDARTISTELDELWSTDVGGASGFPGIGDASVYVASKTEADVLFTSLAREDGDENWVSTIDDADFGALVGEFDDVTVVSACVFDVETVCSVIGLDIDDGDEIWREPLGEGFAFESAGRLLGDDGEGLMLLDPATGDRLERIRGVVEYGDFNALLVDDDGDVSAYDDDLQPLLGPARVDDNATVVAFDGERLLVAIRDEVEYVDSVGDVTSGPFLDGEITRLMAIDDSTLIAELGDEVVVYDLDGDDAVKRWSENGTISQVASPDSGPVVVIDTGTDHLIVDLTSGEERFDVDGSIADGVATSAATNAFVVVDRGDIEIFGGDATVTAYDWTTGDQIWSEDIEGNVRVDEVVIVVETDGNVIAFG